MGDNDKVIPINRSTAAPAARVVLSAQKRKEVLKKINAIELKFIKLRLATLFNNIDEYFFDKTGRTVTSIDVKVVFEAMRELREKRDAVDVGLRNAITQQFITICKPTEAVEGKRFDEDSLSLVDNEHLEKSVTINNMVSSTRDKNHRELLLINIGMQTLFGVKELKEDANPLSPQFLCNSFLEASRPLVLDLQTSLVFFKHFERIVARDLSRLYKHVLELLINEQVVDSKLSQYFHRSPQQNKPASTQAQSDTEPKRSALQQAVADANQAAQDADYPDVNLYEAIKSIATTPINFRLPTAIIRQGIANLTGVFAEGELARHLSQQHLLQQQMLQQEQTASLQALGLVNIIPALVKAVLMQHRHEIAKPDEDTINLSSLFFDFVLKDKNQPERIRRLVSQLQLPILKLTLKDKQFFSHKDHPARRLINMIAKAGFGISGSSDADNERLYAKLEIIVEAITTHKEDMDRKLFATQAKALADFMARDEHRLKLIEKRFSESANGAARLEHNTRHVNSVVASRLNDITAFGLPVRRFIDNEFKQLLRQVLLRDGEQSVSWHSLLQLFNGFVALCTNVMSEQEDGAMEKEFQIAGSLIMKNLEQEAIQTTAREIIFASYKLFKAAVTMDREKTFDFLKESQPTAALTASRRFTIATGAAANSEVSEEYLAKAKALPIGQWMEICSHAGDIDGERCKLIARIDLVDRFVFIDAVGKKVAELGQREVALALQSATLRPLNNGPLVERALHCINTNLTQPHAVAKTVDQLIA
jgi:hypothetical protein